MAAAASSACGKNENGEQIHDGRNNLGVISPEPAAYCSGSKGDEATFWKLLDERLRWHGALMTRIARLEGVKARVALILYMEGACGVRLNADDDVSEIFKNGRVCLVTSASTKPLTRCSAASMFTTTSSFARKVSPLLNVCVRQWISGKKKRVMVSVSTARRVKTPCDRFCRLDTAEFGVVPGVTDKGYYTNSFHLDVGEEGEPVRQDRL